MPLAITLGYQAKGRDAEPTLLYVGLDAGKASEIANNPGPGFIRAEYIKAPPITFRRYFEAPENPVPPVNEVNTVTEVPAEDPVQEEEAGESAPDLSLEESPASKAAPNKPAKK